MTWSIFLGLAEAKTSAGAPELICCASAELAPKLNVTFVPGLADSNCLPSSVNDSVSEAAANTVMFPDSELSLADGPGAELVPLSLDPHAARPTTINEAVRRVAANRRMRTPWYWARIQGQRFLGISTETLVAFTAATANTPGSSPRSSTASRLSRETNRCGPA